MIGSGRINGLMLILMVEDGRGERLTVSQVNDSNTLWKVSRQAKQSVTLCRSRGYLILLDSKTKGGRFGMITGFSFVDFIIGGYFLL